MRPYIKDATDAQLFMEIENCKTAKILLSKTAYKKQWQPYENAIMKEIEIRNKELPEMTDDELLAELLN